MSFYLLWIQGSCKHQAELSFLLVLTFLPHSPNVYFVFITSPNKPDITAENWVSVVSFLHLLVYSVYDPKDFLKRKHLLKCMGCIWKWTECMDCAVPLTSWDFFDYTSAEFRKARNLGLIQTCIEWCPSREALFIILAAGVVFWVCIIFLTCGYISKMFKELNVNRRFCS